MVKLTKVERDALMEITNMFSQHISMTIGKLTGGPVDLKVLNKDIVSLHKKETDAEKEPVMHLGIYSNIQKGDLEGNILLAFPKDSALNLYDALKKRRTTSTKIVNEDVKNTLGEIGNMVAGKVLGILNKFLGVDAWHSVPTVVPSFGSQIYDYVFFDLKKDSEHAILIEIDTRFSIGKNEISGQSILLLTHKSFKTLLKIINEKVKE